MGLFKPRYNSILFTTAVTVLVFVMGFVVMGFQQQKTQIYAVSDWTGDQCNLQGQSSQNCCNNIANVRSRTGWSDAQAGTCHNDLVYNCTANGGRWVPSNIWLCPGDSHVRCCVPPAPPATTCTAPNLGCTGTDVCISGKCVAPTATQVSLDLLLHGIGKAGDSQKPGAAGGGNMKPVDTDRDIVVNIYGTGQTAIESQKGKVSFDSTSGSFKGTVDLGTLPSGQYTIKVKFPQSLETPIGNIQTITAGTTIPLPQIELVTGDINGDGAISLNIQDYTDLLSCIQKTSDCTDDKMKQADITDDGNVDLFDFNLFLREITDLSGQK